jgi:hypothetical protein
MAYSANREDVIPNGVIRALNTIGRGRKYSGLRQDMIENTASCAQATFRGKWKETYLQRLAFVDNDNTLTQEEKDEAKLDLTLLKDRSNILYSKDEMYRCGKCGRLGYMIIWCHHCVADFLRDEATKWTSGNEYINRQILLAQIKAPIPEAIPEWIPYEKLANVHYLTQGGYASIYTATYMGGLYTRWRETTRTLSRGLTEFKVVLKRLKDYNQPEINFRNEVSTASHFLLHLY